jgi:hypothetical protein
MTTLRARDYRKSGSLVLNPKAGDSVIVLVCP